MDNGMLTMSARRDTAQSTTIAEQSPDPGFHFRIDGHEYIAVAGAGSAHGGDSTPGTSGAKSVVGQIATPHGHYVILNDERPAGERSVGGTDGLSRRELEVAVLIADGKCDKEIARQLGISNYTVREHIRRIFAKLKVCRRSAVIARLLRNG
jgi:DNA-binding NarL/FixJ family response regulator